MTKRVPLPQWKLIPESCACETCQSMCKNPCWPSPEEAGRLIKLGYGPKMMVAERSFPQTPDATGYKYIPVLSPARPGLEGKGNDSYIEGCVFQKKGLCQLHTICKPIEGRLAICKGREPVDLRDRVAQLWDNKKAQALVDKWVTAFGYDPKAMKKVLTRGYSL
jgi:hypothetical protein